jgi:predicted kinase
VTGHICSGKSTFVRTHSAPADVVIDLDRLALAMSHEDTTHHEYGDHIMHIARVVRWFAIDEAVRLHKRGGFDVWIIHAYPSDDDLARYRRLGAAIAEIRADAGTLRARAAAERPARAQNTLDRMLAAELAAT